MKKFLITSIIFLVSALIFCSPIYENFSFWGQKDWDQFTMWNAVPHKTILTYQQFPLWNPYVNGGTVMMAHPHAPFLSPFYMFVLLFGPIAGLKLQIPIHLFIGLWGMFCLCGFLKMQQIARYFASFVFMFCSMFVLHLTEGHTEWLSMAFMPWYFLCFLKTIEHWKYFLGGAIFLSLILLNGSVDVANVLFVFSGVYMVFRAIQMRSLKPASALASILLLTFLLCSIKLIPMLDFLADFPRTTTENSAVTPTALYHMFLDSDQEILDMMNWMQLGELGLDYDWHEYGAYIGIVPLLLGLLGYFKFFRSHWPLVMTGVVTFIIGMGSGSPLNLWALLHKLPFFDSLTVPSRFMLGFVFTIALIGGLMFSSVEAYFQNLDQSKTKKWRLSWIVYIVCLIVMIDLYESNSSVFVNAFIIPPEVYSEEAAFAQRYFYINIFGKRRTNSSLYPIFLTNTGVVDGYEVTQVKRGKVKIKSADGYRGEVYLDDTKGEYHLEEFTPNKLTVTAKLEDMDVLVVNQNFHKGWNVRVNGERRLISSAQGLLSTILPPGQHKIEFYYLPISFLLGLVVSLLSVGVSIYMFLTRKWQVL